MRITIDIYALHTSVNTVFRREVMSLNGEVSKSLQHFCPYYGEKSVYCNIIRPVSEASRDYNTVNQAIPQATTIAVTDLSRTAVWLSPLNIG